MNTYEWMTLPRAWRAALGCAFSKSEDVIIWGPDAYGLLIDAIPSDQFGDYLHLKWLVYDLGELLASIMAD